MKTSDIIAVLQAYERGEKIECKGKMENWRECPEPLWSFDTNDYRIAPNKLGLVEELRQYRDMGTLASRAADRICELERYEAQCKTLNYLPYVEIDTLLAEIKRRVEYK